jgi:hypothetical protein
MKLEAFGKPFIYRWPGGEVRFEPGKPVDVEPERARRILAKLGDRVRPVGVPQPGEVVTWDSPLFGTCTGEVLATHPDGSVLVWHPSTDRLAKIPADWMRTHTEGAP